MNLFHGYVSGKYLSSILLLMENRPGGALKSPCSERRFISLYTVRWQPANQNSKIPLKIVWAYFKSNSFPHELAGTSC